MKFINTSKAEVERKRSMKLDIRSSVLSEDSDEEEEEEEKRVKTTSPRQDLAKIHHSKSLGSLGKQDSFSKLLDSFGKIM